MKKVSIAFCLLILFLLVSCRFPETYNFKHPTDDIIEISIVELSFGENGKLIETKIRQIADTESFLADFKKIECYMYFGDPLGVTPEGVEDTVIKITYENGEYELINWKGQAEYTSEKGLIYYAGYCVFDEKQFESLLENSGTDSRRGTVLCLVRRNSQDLCQK